MADEQKAPDQFSIKLQSIKPRSPRRWASILRICIYGQILWTIFVALLAREVIVFDPEVIGVLILQGCFLALMIFSLIALWKVEVSDQRRFALVLIEIGLIIVCIVAVLPAVQ